jgi:hypothetical protein
MDSTLSVVGIHKIVEDLRDHGQNVVMAPLVAIFTE